MDCEKKDKEIVWEIIKRLECSDKTFFEFFEELVESGMVKREHGNIWSCGNYRFVELFVVDGLSWAKALQTAQSLDKKGIISPSYVHHIENKGTAVVVNYSPDWQYNMELWIWARKDCPKERKDDIYEYFCRMTDEGLYDPRVVFNPKYNWYLSERNKLFFIQFSNIQPIPENLSKDELKSAYHKIIYG